MTGVVAGVRESLLGPSYAYHRRLIERSKSWSAEQIRRYQEARFGRLIQRYGDEITVKEDYRRSLARYTRWDIPLLTQTVRTSGTVGEPFGFRADTFARRQKERAYLFDIWSQAGYRPYDLRLTYRDFGGGGGLARFDRLENQLHISLSATSKDQVDTVRRMVRTLPPFFFHAYPSSLKTFIDLVGEDFFRRLPVRGVLAGSEAFPAGERERFEAEFGLRIAHWYGHSEYAVLAYFCRTCRGFHFYPTYGYVELLPSATEGCQKIVASSFNSIGTQFVRYDTGDLSVASVGECPEDHFPRVGGIVGRTQETFVDKLGKRRALFGYVFGNDKSTVWDQLHDLQVAQDKPGVLAMRFVTNPGANKEEIQHFFQDRLPMVSLEFEYVPAIERTPGGKRRYFINTL